MPPKAKITKEMIVDSAFKIVRKEGADKVTARSISEQLNCSTQPVLYYFSTVEDIKKAVYKKADEYHSAYIMDTAYGHFPRPSGPRSPARQGHIKRSVLRLAEQRFFHPANHCC